MSSEELLAKIAQRLEDHITSHERDRDEAKERYKQDRERQDQWRQGIEDKLEPIYRDHIIVTGIMKWIGKAGSLVLGTIGLVKGWFIIKDHL